MIAFIIIKTKEICFYFKISDRHRCGMCWLEVNVGLEYSGAPGGFGAPSALQVCVSTALTSFRTAFPPTYSSKTKSQHYGKFYRQKKGIWLR